MGTPTQGADARRTAVHWTDRHPASNQCKGPRHSGRGENPLAGFVLRERANACTSDNTLATFRGLPSPAPPDPTGKPRRKLPPTRPRHRWPSGSGWEGDPGQAAQTRELGEGPSRAEPPSPATAGTRSGPVITAVFTEAQVCAQTQQRVTRPSWEGNPERLSSSLSFPSSASHRTWGGAGPRGGQPQALQPSPSPTLPPPASQPLLGLLPGFIFSFWEQRCEQTQKRYFTAQRSSENSSSQTIRAASQPHLVPAGTPCLSPPASTGWGPGLAQMVQNPPANFGRFDPWVGNTPGGGNGSPLQYSCLGNLMDRGAWWATGHGVAKSWA